LYGLVGLALLWPGQGIAAQKLFERRYLGQEVLLHYRWQDALQDAYELVFRLDMEAAALGNREFQPFDNEAANTFALEAVKKYAVKHSQGAKRIEIQKDVRGFRVVYHGMNQAEHQAHEQAIEEVQEQAFDRYLKQAFYMRYADYVMPDHRNIARRYVRAMQPIATKVREQTRGMNRRQVVNYLLGFLQTIPYDELRDRTTSNGAGFQTPYGLFINNRGDCDTKSVALAAILRKLYPRQRLVIVYVPDHAFVGIHAQPGARDVALQLGGQPFVLADPTGPAIVPLGQVETTSAKYLQQGRYSYQEIPF
jgi:hypothetical protein